MPTSQIRPKILGFINEQASAWVVATFAFLVGAVLTAVLAMANFELYQRQLRQRFDLLANERFSRIQERLDGQAYRLDSLRRFFTFSDTVTRAEFNGFADPLLIGTQAYSWAPKVLNAQRHSFEQQAVAEGLTGFTIRQIAQNGTLETAGVRPDYFPMLFTRSRSSLPLPLGFDIGSESVRRDAIDLAGKLGAMVATPRVNLVGLEPENSSGVLLLAPVMSAEAGPVSEVSGFVMAVISLSKLMTEGLPSQDNLTLTMRDLTSPAEPQLLFQSATPAASDEMQVSTLLRMANRDYLLDIRPTEMFMNSNQSLAGSVIFMGGLLSLLLSALLYNLVSQRQRALRLVDERTAELCIRERQLRGAHGELSNVLNAATDVAIIATDLNGVISTFNVGAQKMLGYSEDEVLGHFRLKDLQLAAELEDHAQHLSQAYGYRVTASQAIFVEANEAEGHKSHEWTFVRHDGSSLTVNMLVTAVRNEHEQWVGYLAVCIDITERTLVYEALAARDLLLKKISAHVPGGIYQYQMDADGQSRFNYINDGMCELHGMTHEQMLLDFKSVFARVHPLDAQRVKDSMRASAQEMTPWHDEYRLNVPGHGLRWVHGHATPEAQPGGAVIWHGFLSEITDMKRVEEELRALSVTDVLTGAYNRRYFQERLNAELARVHRHGGALSLIMLDIDHFKRINDEYGHAVGDTVLQAICQRITTRLRRSDVFCRLGGEEFMVLCPGNSATEAHELAIQLWTGLRSHPVEGVGLVTASFGVASWRAGEGADALLLRADSGVYAAKQAGRDRVECESQETASL
ncbi:sensor domain-containing diguanylate cyclase [Pseudomonas viridiflava]|uniref:sensor domain-containing diguanylate cyclase n=1 Tax=Pseudomonas viridiflava TaxID=33069 RepID=UPI000F05E930|nr:diguanylate cyclase [Pseudomonas viridiflava]